MIGRQRHALERIAHLSRQEATGELICASDELEVHVYLQQGRVAWATDASHPLAFTRYLLEEAQIEVEVFREILESCRREKRPLGETLIAWGVATREEVKEALRHQIELALGALASLGPVESLFLNRSSQFASYDVGLTFRIGELAVPDLPRRSSRTFGAVTPNASLLQCARSVLDGVVWLEALEDAKLVESFPTPLAESRVSSTLVRRTLLDGANLVVIRSHATTLAGVAVAPSSSLWCLIDDAMTVGAVTAALSSLISSNGAGRRTSEKPPAMSIEPRTIGRGDPRVEEVLRELARAAPEVEGVFVTSPRSAFGLCRGVTPEDELLSLIEQRAEGIGACWRQSCDSTDGAPPPVEADGVTPYRAMTSERRCSLFATELVISGEARVVWLALDGRSAKGLGWGYLTTFGRTLARALSVLSP